MSAEVTRCSGQQALTLALALAVNACVNSSQPEPSSPALEEEENVTAGGRPELSWRALAKQGLDFIAPENLSLSTLAAGPTEAPPDQGGPKNAIEELPVDIWPSVAHCFPSWTPAFCSHEQFDLRGQLSLETRVEYAADKQAIVVSYKRPSGYVDRFERCWHDAQDRVVKRQVQTTHRWDEVCRAWDVNTISIGYDDQGGPAFSKDVREQVLPGRTDGYSLPDDSGVEIYQTSYEAGRPVQITAHEANLDFSFTDLLFIQRHEWTDGRLTRSDSFDRSGEWSDSEILIWSGDLLRVDRFRPPLRDSGAANKTRIYQRRGPGDYALLYDSPDTHWEYESADGIETVTKFVNELAVERRRFALVEDERRPLTVEKLVPERVGLELVERWDWSSPDRVVVERQDGHDVYLLDCSELPPIESLIDPDCPPPRPIR